MDKKLILALAALAIIAILLGCQNQGSLINSTPVNTSNEAAERPPVDIVEKRGMKTNITDFDELLLRGSKIQAFKFNITKDSAEYRYYFLGRFVKVELPAANELPGGEKYDEVLMDRITKQAFTHCSGRTCPKPNLDKEVEKTSYDKFIEKDPIEQMYMLTNVSYIGEEMLGDQYTKVFSAKYNGKDAKAWIQEYYGFPLRIEMPDAVIEYEDIKIDATRSIEVSMPFNFTIKGEEGTWWTWEHYLGLLKAGQEIKPSM